MGHIAIISPPSINSIEIQRRKVTDDEILSVSQIEKHFYAPSTISTSPNTYAQFDSLDFNTSFDLNMHILWSCMWYFKDKLPMYKGYMSEVCKEVRNKLMMYNHE